MAGMLTYGAVAGVGDEWLKQSDEERKNAYQEIRDNRLSELKKGELTHAAKEKTKSDRDRPFSGAASSDVFQYDEKSGQYEKTHSVDDRPLSPGSTTQKGNLVTMTSGDQRTFEELRKNWEGMAFTKDDFGNPIRNPDVAEFDEWFNARVQPQHRINPKEAEADAPEEPDTDAVMEANKWYDDTANVTDSDQSQFGMTEKEVKDKKAREIMATRKKQPGMLSESESVTKKPRKQTKVKTPLSQAAKTDPVQMYAELMAQFGADSSDVGEQDIIDTIRLHFEIPDWQPPADALQSPADASP